jgi:hypothetical protein
MERRAIGGNAPFLGLLLADLFAQEIDVSEITHDVASVSGLRGHSVKSDAASVNHITPSKILGASAVPSAGGPIG